MAKKTPPTLNEEEQDALLQVLDTRYRTNLRDKSMFLLMLDSGLRVGEVTSLKLRHVDRLRNRIEIKDSKGAKDRVVTIPDPSLELMDDWIDKRAELIEEGTFKEPKERWVYITKRGKPVKRQHLDRKIKRCAKKAGIDKDIYPHVLRHSFATDLYTDTKDLAKVQETLGHRSLDTTRIYVHLAQADVSESVKNLRSDREV